MAVNISQTLQMIATMPGQKISEGISKAAQIYAQRQQQDKENKIAEQKVQVQQTANKIKQAEFRKGVMQDLSFEVSKANAQYDEGIDRDMAISDIVYRHKDNLILSGASEEDVDDMAGGDLPDSDQMRTIASTNKEYNKILNPEEDLYSEGAVFDKQGKRLSSATRDDQGDIKLDSGVAFDPETMEYNRVSVQATTTEGVGMKNPWTKAGAQATKSPQETIRDTAEVASQSLPANRRLLEILQSPEWEGGSFTALGGKLNNVLTSLGMKPIADSLLGLGDADKVYEAMGLAADQVLNKFQTIKGNASNKEVAIAETGAFGVDNPKQAAIMKVKMVGALSRKMIKREEMLDSHLQDPANTQGYIGFQEKWRKYSESHPVYVNDKKKGILFYDEQVNGLKTKVRDSMLADPTKNYSNAEIRSEMDKQANRYEEIWVRNYGL